MIKNAYDVYVNDPTPCGSDEKPVFGYVKKVIDDLDDNGKKVGSHEEIVFEQTGSESICEYINSFEDTTDIKKIFERYQMGDVSVLTKRVGDFVDTVGCPETLLDAQLMLKNGDKLFNEIKSNVIFSPFITTREKMTFYLVEYHLYRPFIAIVFLLKKIYHLLKNLTRG